MTSEVLYRRLTNATVYDMMIHSPLSSRNGNKISIQGKSVEDSIFLYQRLFDWLYDNQIPFKVATLKRYSLANCEQSKKAMTIYCPDGVDFSELCEDVYSKIMDYKGWYNINTPNGYEHYAGGLFIRNDRDSEGNYIPAHLAR